MFYKAVSAWGIFVCLCFYLGEIYPVMFLASPGWLHTKLVPYSLYYFSSPSAEHFIFCPIYSVLSKSLKAKHVLSSVVSNRFASCYSRSHRRCNSRCTELTLGYPIGSIQRFIRTWDWSNSISERAFALHELSWV